MRLEKVSVDGEFLHEDNRYYISALESFSSCGNIVQRATKASAIVAIKYTDKNIADSSNGRTLVSGTSYWGSSP